MTEKEMKALVEKIVAALRELAWDAYHFRPDPREGVGHQLDPLVAKAKERIADAIRPTT